MYITNKPTVLLPLLSTLAECVHNVTCSSSSWTAYFWRWMLCDSSKHGNYLSNNEKTWIFSDTIERTTNLAWFCYIILGLQFQLPIYHIHFNWRYTCMIKLNVWGVFTVGRWSYLQAKDDVNRLTEDIKEGSLQLSNMILKIEDLKYAHRNLLELCKVTFRLRDDYITITNQKFTHFRVWEFEQSALQWINAKL